MSHPPPPPDPAREAVRGYRRRVFGVAAAVFAGVAAVGGLAAAGLVRAGGNLPFPPLGGVSAAAAAGGVAVAAWLMRRGVSRRAVAAALDDEAGLNDRLLTLAVHPDAGDPRLARLRREFGSIPRSRRGTPALRLAAGSLAAAVLTAAAWLLVEPRGLAAAAAGVVRGTAGPSDAAVPVLVGPDGRPLGRVRDVSANTPFPVRVRWRVRPAGPDDVRLFVRHRGGGSRGYAPLSGGGGVYPVPVGTAVTDVAVRSGNGGPSASAVLRPVAAPTLAGVSLRVTPPPYLGAAPYRVPAGRVELVAGSRLTVRLGARHAAGPPVLRGGGRWTADGLDPDARTAPFDEPGRFELTAELRGRLPGSTVRTPIATVVVTGDGPPSVRLERGPGGVTVTPTATPPVTASAEDDRGIASLALILTRPPAGGPSTTPAPDGIADGAADPPADRVSLLPGGPADVGGGHPRSVRRSVRLTLAGRNLAPGDRVRVVAAAEDARGAAGLTRSDPLDLLVVTPEEKRDELAARAAGPPARLDAAADRLADDAAGRPRDRADAAARAVGEAVADAAGIAADAAANGLSPPASAATLADADGPLAPVVARLRALARSDAATADELLVAADALRELADRLGRAADDADRRRTAATLADRQRALIGETAAWAGGRGTSDRLAAAQRSLAADALAGDHADAAAAMRTAADALAARRPLAAADAQRDALRSLTAAAADGTPAEGAGEPASTVDPALAALAAEQIAVARRIADRAPPPARWTRADLLALRDLRVEEERIGEAVRALADGVRDGGRDDAVAAELTRAADDAAAASSRLNDRVLDEETVSAAARAADRLAVLAAAGTAEAAAPDGPDAAEPGPADAAPSAGAPSAGGPGSGPGSATGTGGGDAAPPRPRGPAAIMSGGGRWGDLPPRLRERLAAAAAAEVPARYADLADAYHRSLGGGMIGADPQDAPDRPNAENDGEFPRAAP